MFDGRGSSCFGTVLSYFEVSLFVVQSVFVVIPGGHVLPRNYDLIQAARHVTIAGQAACVCVCVCG